MAFEVHKKVQRAGKMLWSVEAEWGHEEGCAEGLEFLGPETDRPLGSESQRGLGSS